MGTEPVAQRGDVDVFLDAATRRVPDEHRAVGPELDSPDVDAAVAASLLQDARTVRESFEQIAADMVEVVDERDVGDLSPLAAGVFGAVLATWVTFVPSFL